MSSSKAALQSPLRPFKGTAHVEQETKIAAAFAQNVWDTLLFDSFHLVLWCDASHKHNANISAGAAVYIDPAGRPILEAFTLPHQGATGSGAAEVRTVGRTCEAAARAIRNRSPNLPRVEKVSIFTDYQMAVSMTGNIENSNPNHTHRSHFEDIIDWSYKFHDMNIDLRLYWVPRASVPPHIMADKAANGQMQSSVAAFSILRAPSLNTAAGKRVRSRSPPNDRPFKVLRLSTPSADMDIETIPHLYNGEKRDHDIGESGSAECPIELD